MVFEKIRRAEAVTLGLVALSLVLLALPAEHQLAAARTSNDVLLLPLSQVRQAFGGYLRLRNENADLRQALQQARLRLASIEATRRENAQLRQLLSFGRDQPVRLVPARVVDRNFATVPTTFVIDAGREDGVVENLPVVNASGLVGKTVAVGPATSQVMVFSHPDFSASALLVGGDHLEYGIVRPTPSGALQLFLPLRSVSEPGDRIVTSGYGGTFPRGLPLGQVEGVQEDERLSLQRIDLVRPAVDLGRVSAVFVLMRGTPSGESAGDVVRLFWPGYAYPPMAGETLGGSAAARLDSLAADSLASDSLAADSARPVR